MADHLVAVAQGKPEELTIDELARVASTTVRNVRSLQSQGLLPPPEIRARTGYYGPEHVERVRMILAMQAEGFRLKAIKRLLDRPEGAAEQIFSFGHTLLQAFGGPTPEFATTAELEERFGDLSDARLLRKAEKLGLVRSLGEQRWEVLAPALISAGEQLVEIGIPLSHVLAVAEKIQHHANAIAKEYVRMFRSDVLGGEAIDTRSADEWARLQEALERLRPLAVESIRAAFESAMSEQIESVVRKAMED